MHIAWHALLVVFVVAFAAAVTLVVLVSFALVALSERTDAPRPERTDAPLPDTTALKTNSPVGRAIAGLCLATAALIVLYGLHIIVR
jgi:ABC-type transporter Mla subunit MlaD